MTVNQQPVINIMKWAEDGKNKLSVKWNKNTPFKYNAIAIQ